MKLKRILCLCLACAFCVLPLWSCDGGGSGDGGDGGGLNEDGSVNWDEVDFKGATLRFGISTDTASGGTFKPAKDYLAGPDKQSTDEVLKKVVARNSKAEADLGMKVEYLEINAGGGYNEVQADIKTRVLGSSTDSPDIYNNDMRAFTYAMVEGYLMNVANPTDKSGNELTSYFDFENDCWNYEFMREMTFDTRKVYVLAGDFHIDMVRMAQVLFVNKTMFNQNAQALGFQSVDDFYDYVDSGVWDYDMLVNMCDVIWQDDGTTKNKTDLEDSRVGFVSNERLYFNFVPSTGVTTFYMDKDGTPKLVDDIDEMNRMGAKLRQIWYSGYTGDGIVHEGGLDCIDKFMQENVLIAPSMMGELESDQLRNVEFDKGLVPIPKYDSKRQEDYHTMVEMYAELSAILVNAPSFTRASAYLQYINEQSDDVLNEYYNFSLKFKYNDDPAIRKMIDLVYETIDSPFGIWYEAVILDYVDGESTSQNLHWAISTNALSSFYEANKTAYRKALEKVLEKFAKLP